MDRALYLDDVRPGEPYDAKSFCTIVEASSTKLVIRTDSLTFVEMAGDTPMEVRVGQRKVLREAKA